MCPYQSEAWIGSFSHRTNLKIPKVLADISGMRTTIAKNSATLAAELLPSERRRKDRMQVSMPVRITYQASQDEICQDGTCTDLSETGVAFETVADLYVGEIVDLEFRQQDGDLLRLPVRLLYKMGNRYGAYFTSRGS